MSRPIEFPSPRGSTWLNPDFVVSITAPTLNVLRPERHCLVMLITGASIVLAYSAAAVASALFEPDGEPPRYEHCCDIHDPSDPDAPPVVVIGKCIYCTSTAALGPYGHDPDCLAWGSRVR